MDRKRLRTFHPVHRRSQLIQLTAYQPAIRKKEQTELPQEVLKIFQAGKAGKGWMQVR